MLYVIRQEVRFWENYISTMTKETSNDHHFHNVSCIKYHFILGCLY